SLGSEPLGSVMWFSGEPNNYGGSEDCGSVISTGWNDIPCGFTLPSVCFDGSKTGNDRYIYISTTRSWAEAQAFCRQYYTDLVSIKDPTENSVIAEWSLGTPGLVCTESGCRRTVLNHNAFLLLLMFVFECVFAFLHLVITEKQQIVKVKVRSNQDVNDPQVKVAILGQIKQKLKDHGMTENITVKWREESDGRVFHKEKEEL
ncbi:hypothetical protein QTP70_021812, partial [Hemibagrus guttatus]